jgi:hypothetical protein
MIATAASLDMDRNLVTLAEPPQSTGFLAVSVGKFNDPKHLGRHGSFRFRRS